MNHLLQSENEQRWSSKSDKDLMTLRDELNRKLDVVRSSSPAVYKSLKENLDLLEEYLKKRGIF